ncbi:hypothetical protein [Salinigranum sp. GCM10025319]|uniref:hypothetical protein n=1 Tax=Salinigranum sp. GCM10025319 TaxID=3252687 RepID=UPI00361857EB
MSKDEDVPVVEDGGTDDDPVDTDHLDDLEAGAGCTEIWEHLSERRERAGSD